MSGQIPYHISTLSIPNINPSDESTQKQPSLNLIYCVDKSCFTNLDGDKFRELEIEKIWSNSVPDSNIGKDLNNEDTSTENNEKEIINFGASKLILNAMRFNWLGAGWLAGWAGCQAD